MKKIQFSKGTNIYDFFIIPTIRITYDNAYCSFLTIEWLKWYIGISWD